MSKPNPNASIAHSELDKPPYKRKRNKYGAPAKITPKTEKLILDCIHNGLTIAQACRAAKVTPSALRTWRERYPEFETILDAARENVRSEALGVLKTHGDDDWRATDAFLRHSFQETPIMHQQPHAIVQIGIVSDEGERARLIELRQQLLGEQTPRERASNDFRLPDSASGEFGAHNVTTLSPENEHNMAAREANATNVTGPPEPYIP